MRTPYKRRALHASPSSIERRWVVTLDCLHTVYVTTVRKRFPGQLTVPCPRCIELAAAPTTGRILKRKRKRLKGLTIAP